jgi:hypothetical protein
MRTKEQNAARMRAWVASNRDKKRKNDAASYARRREKILIQQRETYHKNKLKPGNRDRLRNNRLKCVYGITLDEKKVLYDYQKGLCFICEKRLPSLEKSVVEHNHTTEEVRGLAHNVCNVRLGVIEYLSLNDPNALQNMLGICGV